MRITMKNGGSPTPCEAFANGQTRMRISMKNGSSPGPCEIFFGGEVEDYTVDFGSAPAMLERSTEFDLNLYPNPASNTLNIKITNALPAVNVKVYNALGRIIDDFDTSEKILQLDISKFNSGVYYIGIDNGVENTLVKFIKN